MAQEIEILVALHDTIDAAVAKLGGFRSGGVREIVDVYYHDPLRDTLGWDKGAGQTLRFKAGCRIREQNGQCFLTYKVNHFDGDIWLYADEHEVSVSDAATAKTILQQLGLAELVTVHNTRHVFATDLYEIVIEDVANLGRFLEVEYIGDNPDGQSVTRIKANLMAFIQSLGLTIGAECNLGKPEMMMLQDQT